MEQDNFMKGIEDQLQRPVRQLSGDLHNLGRINNAPSLVMLEQESWLPFPPIAESDGRRVLYTTIALSPQLEQLTEAQADATGITEGEFEEMALDDLTNHLRARH